MNLPEPSGSSPPEKPPGSITICAFAISAAIRSIVSSMSAEDRFFTIKISGSAPANSNARAVSTSQFVPGNTGMKTLGFAALIAGVLVFRSVYNAISVEIGVSSALDGKIGSRVSIQPPHSVSKDSAVPLMVISFASEVKPMVIGSKPAPITAS